jgi:ribose transport system permease protein
MAMKKFGGILLVNYRPILLGVIVIMASVVIQDPVQNFINVLALQAPYVFIYSCGMSLAILTGGLDLSQGSTAAFASCVGAMAVINGHTAAGILLCVLVGAAVGAINGLLIAKAKVPPFIATYGMDWAIRGITYIMMGGAMIYGFSDEFMSISKGSIFGISNLLYIAVIVFVVLFFFTKRTVFGRNLYMTGSNAEAARLSGVRTGNVIMAVYTISGALAAFAGILYVARLDAAEAFLGRNFGITALAATLIGGTSLEGGKGGIANTVVGVLIMIFLTNALNVWRVPVLWQDAVFGVAIMVSALLEKARTGYLVKRLS